MGLFVNNNKLFIFSSILLLFYILNTEVYFDAIDYSMQVKDDSFFHFFTSWPPSDTFPNFELRFINVSRIISYFLNKVFFPFFTIIFIILSVISLLFVIHKITNQKTISNEYSFFNDFIAASLVLSPMSYVYLKVLNPYSIFFILTPYIFLAKSPKDFKRLFITIGLYPSNLIYYFYTLGVYLFKQIKIKEYINIFMFYSSIVLFLGNILYYSIKYYMFYGMIYISKIMGNYSLNHYIILISCIFFLYFYSLMVYKNYKTKDVEFSLLNFFLISSLVKDINIVGINYFKNEIIKLDGQLFGFDNEIRVVTFSKEGTKTCLDVVDEIVRINKKM